MEKTPHSTQINFAGRSLKLETGKFANLADGAITVTYGETVVLATAVVSSAPRDGIDYFPLMVDYEERLYAAGKISGSRFIKREGRPSEAAVLNARLIDRPLRPLFPKQFKNDVQVICTILSYDEDSDPDIIAIVGASAAVLQTRAPFAGPVAAVRIGLISAQAIQADPKLGALNNLSPETVNHLGQPHYLVVNPSANQRAISELDLVIAGTMERLNMIEAGANQVNEAIMVQAMNWGQQELQALCQVQLEFNQEDKIVVDYDAEKLIWQAVSDLVGSPINEAILIREKASRETALDMLLTQAQAGLEGKFKQAEIASTFQAIVESRVRQAILAGQRPDGRQITEVRPISSEVGLLPRTHGSALFTRGQTQALTIATLGGPGEQQMIDTMELEGEKRYMHHYNFPPYSVGEVKPMRGASRRDIGHGALAERALIPVLPDAESFPYTIRLVSEILASNGSSSMAATCGSTLALMDAGVPIKAPVAGIAIGLITESASGKREKSAPIDRYQVLTDIQGIEDFAGDMDFKVAGTVNGVTAIQMDTKLAGLSPEIIQEAMDQAHQARLGILAKMQQTIAAPRAELSPYAPRIISIQIPIDKIGTLIGPGGKNIKKIIDAAGGKELVNVDIDDNGLVAISSTDTAAAEQVRSTIEAMTKEFKIGEIYQGPILEIIKDRNSGKEIGAIVELAPGKDGMVHISEVANERIPTVSSVVKVGQVVKVKVVAVDPERGRISLSIRQAMLPAQENQTEARSQQPQQERSTDDPASDGLQAIPEIE